MADESNPTLKRLARTIGQATAWEVEKSHVGAYAGGKVAIAERGGYAACQYGADVAFLALESGVVCHTVRQLAELSTVTLSPSEAFTTFALHPDGLSVVTASRNLLVRRWILSAAPTSTAPVEISCERSWKAVHRLPAVCMEFDATGTLVATGSGDRAIMVYDVVRGYCTHNFRGAGGSGSIAGVVSAVRFSEVAGRGLQLFSCSDGDSSVRVWDLTTSTLVAQLNGHASTVSDIAFSPCGRVLLSAGRDQIVNFWDVGTHTLVHTQATFEVIESICTTVTAPGDGSSVEFATAGSTGAVRVWRAALRTEVRKAAVPEKPQSLKKRRKLARKREAEGTAAPAPAAPTTVVVGVVCRKVGGQPETKSTQGGATSDAVPLTSVRLLPRAPPRIAVGDDEEGMEEEPEAEEEPKFLSITQDQRFVFLAMSRSGERVRLSCERQVIGFNDEIIDLTYIPTASDSSNGESATPTTRIAMATNSERACIIDVETFNTRFLEGHSDLVLAIASSPCGRFVSTGAKDHTIRVWAVADGSCVAACIGHTAEIGALAMPSMRASFSPAIAGRPCWLVSGSKDKSVKVWDLHGVGAKESDGKGKKAKGKAIASRLLRARVLSSQRVHTKDINAVATSPNDKMVATASQDKTIRLFSLRSEGKRLTLVEQGELRGHKRGVWSVAFSPVDKCLASASADKTVKLWSIDAKRCIRTFEGHSSSVLKVAFLPLGIQLVSSGADGLVKVWSLQTAECQTTLERHSDRVWALAVAPHAETAASDAEGDAENASPLMMVSGGADSTLVFWKDVSAAQEEKGLAAQEETVLKEQELANVLRAKDFKRAVWLAMDLDKPYRLKKIFKELVESGNAANAEGEGDEERKTDTLGEVVLTAVRVPKRLAQLLRYVLDWNTRASDMRIAQQILERILRHVSPSEILRCDRSQVARANENGEDGEELSDRLNGCDLRQTLEALIAYSERHAVRIERLQRSCALFDFTLGSMKKIASTTAEKL